MPSTVAAWELHARIAGAIERLTGRIAEHVERLAHHAVRGELWEKALAYLSQAGLRATERLAFPEAVDYLEQAIAAASRHPRPARRSRRRSTSASPSVCEEWSLRSSATEG